jgi:hypothetical protein
VNAIAPPPIAANGPRATFIARDARQCGQDLRGFCAPVSPGTRPAP